MRKQRMHEPICGEWGNTEVGRRPAVANGTSVWVRASRDSAGLVAAMEQFALDVGGKFVQRIGDGYAADASEDGAGRREVAAIAVGIVEVGQCFSGTRSADYREVKRRLSGVLAGDDCARGGVESAAGETAGAFAVVAGILVEHGGDDSFAQEGRGFRANHGVADALTVRFPTLSPLRI